ncbi:MAG: type II secretion system protein [Planctomycetota bacterium]|nr:type II secretion system protein [Planctomycetota bacterium]
MREGRESTRRGLTILEMTLAVALLSIVAAAGFSATQFVFARHEREQRRLAAAEMASRLLIQYVDDKNKMPSEFDPINYGALSFRYTKSDAPIGVKEFKPVPTSGGGRQSLMSMESCRQITVRVWLSEESGGSFDGSGNAPSATLTRIYNPMRPVNPDSFENKKSSGFAELTRDLLESGAAGQQLQPGREVRGGRTTPGDRARPARQNPSQAGKSGSKPEGEGGK